MAREKPIDAKKAVAQGKSPAHEKQREKRRLTAAKTFGDVTGKWGGRSDDVAGATLVYEADLLMQAYDYYAAAASRPNACFWRRPIDIAMRRQRGEAAVQRGLCQQVRGNRRCDE